MPAAIEMQGIRKVFPGVIANDGIDLQIEQGEIHALIGENGAGKTTLMNILYGLYQPDAGRILIGGQPVRLSSPRIAIDHGIGMVHQHFMLIPPLTVAENIVLGREPAKRGFYDRNKARQDILDLCKVYGLQINPDALTENISVGLQQRAEILKVLYRGADILIMDEPTGVLTPQETQELFGVLRTLVNKGKTIIFITHKLREVLEISNRITVLRRGRIAGHLFTTKTNEAEIARMMVGRDVLLRVEKNPATPGETVLRIKDLEVNSDRGLPAVRGVSFEVREGEILGVAGIEGNGQSELVEVLTGLRPVRVGEIWIKGNLVTGKSVAQRRRAGLAHIPEDRRESGLILNYTVEDNLILGRHRWSAFAHGMVLHLKSIAEWAKRLIIDYDIRPPRREAPARTLSGGNQQKVVIAREFAAKPSVLIASQPTRGVDIGAIESIHRRLIEQRDGGVAVLLLSAELEEIRSLSDRIAVIYEGRFVAILDAGTTEEQLGLLMAGAGKVEQGRP